MTIPNLTQDQREALAGLLQTDDVDVLREMVEMVLDTAMQAQFRQHIGADLHERSDERQDLRNGTRSRGLNTRVGSIDLLVPRARHSNFRPAIIERFRRSERALVAVIQEAFVRGISTRDMEAVLARMGVERLSRSQVSELCQELDEKAETFRNRELSEPYPYLWLDAVYEKARVDDRVVSNAVVIAYGVTANGYRDVLGVDVVDTESKESWTTFLRQLRKRGLKGTKLVISDAHEGLKAAIAATMSGASWQRCKVHFFRNVLAHVPQSRKSEVAIGLRAIFSQVSKDAALRAVDEFRKTFGKALPKATAILDAGLSEALTFLSFPIEHHRNIASTNPIEHLNREIRRRTRAVGVFPSPQSALRLITMVLVEQSEDWMTGRRYMSPESLELVLQM